MGWLRSVKSIQLYASFAKEQKRRYSAKETYNFIDPTAHSHPIAPLAYFAEYRLFDRALLQKRPVILSILLPIATP